MAFVIVRLRGEIIDTTSPEDSHGVCRLLLCPPTKLLTEHQLASHKYCQAHKTLIVTMFWGFNFQRKDLDSIFSSQFWKTKNVDNTGLIVFNGEVKYSVPNQHEEVVKECFPGFITLLIPSTRSWDFLMVFRLDPHRLIQECPS